MDIVPQVLMVKNEWGAGYVIACRPVDLQEFKSWCGKTLELCIKDDLKLWGGMQISREQLLRNLTIGQFLEKLVEVSEGALIAKTQCPLTYHITG